MKFPLDTLTFNETVTKLVSHSNMQTVIIDKMAELLDKATYASESDEDEWYIESLALLKDLELLKTEHESRRWNEANYQSQVDAGAIKAPPKPVPQGPPRSKVVKHLAVQPEETMVIVPDEVATVAIDPVIQDLQNIQFDITMDQKANKLEESFGGEMSEEDLDRHFNQKRDKKKKDQPKGLNKMTLEEIQSWEKAQDNSSDVYKIKARVANLARGANASLTPQGEMLCNTYVHVMKSFYDFAEKIEDKTVKINLINLIRSQEGMPGTLIAAAGAGVSIKK